MKNNIKLKLFLGNHVKATYGEWITLPKDEPELKEIIQRLNKQYGGLIIADYSKEADELECLHIGQYSNVLELNYIIQQPKEFLALYIHGDEDLEYANEMWKRGEYIYLPDVTNTSELGEAIAKIGLIPGINKHLIDLGYIDFEQIGTDFECNGLVLYNKIGAIGQISEDDYIKFRDKPINAQAKALSDFLIENGVSKEALDNLSEYCNSQNSNHNLFIKNLIKKYEESHGFKITELI